MEHAPPVFIVGSGRCGTTMLAELLDRFTGIAVTAETHFVTQLGRGEGETDSPSESVRRRLAQQVARQPRYGLLQLGWDADALLAVTSQIGRGRAGAISGGGGYRSMVTAMYEQFAERRGKQRWADQTPQYIHDVDRLVELFPEAKFIHMVRDGRDCAVSVMKCPWGPRNVYRAATWWRDALEAGERAEAMLRARNESHAAESGVGTTDADPGDGGTWLEVRYEAVLESPLNEMQRICDFVGEAMTDAMQAVCQRDEDAPYRLAGHNSEKWRGELSARQIECFESIAGDWLERLGYARACDEPRAVGALSRVAYQLHHRVASVPLNMGDVKRWWRKQAA